MNSIAKAINNVAISLSRIAAALETNRINPTPLKPKINFTETSNPNYSRIKSEVRFINDENHIHKNYDDIWRHNR